VRSKVFWELCIAAGALAAGLVSADTVTEYTSLGSWDAAVTDVVSYAINGGVPAGGLFEEGTLPVTFGPGTFVANGNAAGYLVNDGAYGTGVQYFTDSIGLGGGDGTSASLTVSFNASTDVSALAFTIGTFSEGDYVNILVNGMPIAPITLSAGAPTSAFLGVTDTSGPITSTTFTVPISEFSGRSDFNIGEIDVIGSYSTAKAVARAPEIDAASATGAITLLFGSLAVLRRRTRA
jgi:hypothetical protein